ncbi:MAG: GNAT family N-acetyltransferase [Cyanobacteria bacterium P01_A01_bin.84]
MQFPIYSNLKNDVKVELDYMHLQEVEQVRELLNIIILEGNSYPQIYPLSEAEFISYWMANKSYVVRGCFKSGTKILGGFFVKPNFPGRCSHICNAGFIVNSQWRGQGIGRLMAETMLKVAAHLKYEAVMLNLVFETNIPSVRLWESLGFDTIGRIPQGVLLQKGERVDALIMYRPIK